LFFFCQEREPSQIEIEYNHRMNGIHKETACLQTLTREQQRIELDIMLSFA